MPPLSIKGVLLVDDRVVLVKNSRDEWELPGGRAEKGEDHGQTLAREFAEELSISVRVKARIDSYRFEVLPGRHVDIVTYGCGLAGEFRPTVSSEHLEHCVGPSIACPSSTFLLGIGARLKPGRARSNYSPKPTKRMLIQV